ncbi:MAG: zinc-binding dehydrogenase [Firmicutes bacterium]|nr:zinc-binding dehydrogenase [Bacillota bacterium]
MKVWQVVAPRELEQVRLSQKDVEVDGIVKIRTSLVGLSFCDIKMFMGDSVSVDKAYPFSLGTKAVGVISDDAHNFKRGQRVVVDPFIACGSCYMCKTQTVNKQGNVNCSDVQTYINVLGGGLLSDFAYVPVTNLYELPSSIKDEDAIFAEYIALGLNALSQISLEKAEYVAIFGGGITGNILAQLVLYYQAVPIIIDDDEHKLEIAKAHGVYYTVNAKTENVQSKIREITSSRGAEVGVYIASSNLDLGDMLGSMDEYGRVCILGTEYNKQYLNVSLTQILSRQLNVLGVKSGYGFMAQAINILANKAVNLTGLTREVVQFKDVPKVLEKLAGESVPQYKTVVKT